MKIVFTIIATTLGLIGFLPYLRDILKLKTKPHIYTWLIWSITQTTAVIGIIKGDGSWGGLNLIVGIIFVIAISIFSIKYGSKNITKRDTIILILAILSIIVWWQLKQPILSIIMISIINLVGYIPSIRKTYQDPWSETLSTWLLFSIGNIFAFMALYEYNLLTTTYLVSITLANIVMFLVCIFRRQTIKR